MAEPSAFHRYNWCGNSPLGRHASRLAGVCVQRQGEDRMRKLSLSIVFLLLFSLSIWPSAAAPAAAPENSDYHLGVGDQLRIRVFEWRPATGDVHQWDALKGEYDVGSDGSIPMPLLGAVKASGLTTTQLADAISDQLEARLKLSIRPQASIDIVQYRPFYITGDVNKSGAYPYQPGLTVLQAISIAGGRYRVNDPSMVLTATGDLRVNRLAYEELLAREARLRAEVDDAAAITLPPELQQWQNDPGIAQVIQTQQAIFSAHHDALTSETDALNQLKAMLNGEVGSLDAKMKNMDQELTLMKQELSNTTNLVERGLAIAPRAYELRQTELETEGRRLDLDTAMLRAKEDVSKADQALVELRNKTRNQAETDLAEVEQKLRETSARMSNETMIADHETALASSDGGNGADGSQAICLILRKSDGTSKQIQSDESALVEPGDTIQVLRSAVTAAPGMASLSTGTALTTPPPAAHEVAKAAIATPPGAQPDIPKAKTEPARAETARPNREVARRPVNHAHEVARRKERLPPDERLSPPTDE
jgi:polysaccharide biosynthesis/export protein ExoF